MAASTSQDQRSNQAIAEHLEHMAELLETQDANPFRVRAYRQGAAIVRMSAQPVADILEGDGVEGLQRLPNIGAALANAIEQIVHTGTTSLYEQLHGETSPEDVLASVAGIGPKLADQIHERLGIETLPELEQAAHDGRLASVPGFGTARVRAVRESLAGRFHHRRLSQASGVEQGKPPVSELLKIDADYRRRAATGKLPHIAPRRFNPEHKAWLPILHATRGAANYTALFSNTARAHELGTTNDWVVIYRDDDNGSDQWTIVTATSGALKDRRVVRGREAECAAYYDAAKKK